MDTNETFTVDDIRATFGITDEADTAGAEEPETNTSNETSDDQTETEVTEQNDQEAESGGEPEGNTEEEPPKPEAKPEFNQKQNQAFAKMRTDNAQMQKTLSAMAQILGIDPKLPADQLNAQLQAQARTALAKQNNMDPKILERLDYLEDINNRYQQSQNELKAQNAFLEIKEKFHATDDDLKAFVSDIIKDGFDMNKGDLKTEFIQRNFDSIIKNAVDSAVKAEQDRHTKAGDASKPNEKQGQANKSESSDVKSVADLDNLLGNLK